jgi:hypothetical protein
MFLFNVASLIGYYKVMPNGSFRPDLSARSRNEETPNWWGRCHPERSEGSTRVPITLLLVVTLYTHFYTYNNIILRFAQDDRLAKKIKAFTGKAFNN